MLSVAIIGSGQIAGGFDQVQLKENGRGGVYTHAGAYRESKKYNLVTVCDLNAQRASAFHKYWGFKKTAIDLEEVCRQFHDVISICTPDHTHFSIIKRLIETKCCKCIFVEKPIAQTLNEIQELINLATTHEISIIVNFQRRFDKVLSSVREKFNNGLLNILAVNCYYIKGLDHIGTTMIDTIMYFFGYPDAVMAFNKIYNKDVQEDTYEFILFYLTFNVTIKTVDSKYSNYNFHIFEIDILTSNQRILINDNSRQIEIKGLTKYAYSGIKVLNDYSYERINTEYDNSMLNTVLYIHEVVSGVSPHEINTPQNAYNIKLLIDKIKLSYQSQKIIRIEASEWRK
jgi:predicted dehydrogenase